ncbi:MAG: hypothetical protein JNL82_35810 [Myxococcales bacterium]|nr:hypothetical protein [Myxococcales bacterium]
MSAGWLRGGGAAGGRWLALPTLVAVLALVVQATRVLEVAPLAVPAAGKLAQAERAMVYELTTAGGPRFRLAGGAEVVQLLVHLEVPRGLAAGAAFRFAVEATLRGPDGAELWRRTVTQRARQTKEGSGLGGWDYEAAFVVDGQVELTDAASLELALPDAPPGSALELRLSEETGVVVGAQVRPFAAPTALVRAYRRTAVDEAARELRRMALAGSGERRLPETFLPWYALAPAQQELRLAAAWERLAAEGRAGVDYRVRSIYVAPPRPPVAPPAEAPALMLAAGQPLVVQLAGPGTVQVAVVGGAAEVRARLRAVAPGVRIAAGPGDRSGAAGLGDRSGERGGAGPGDRSGEPGGAGPGDRSGEHGGAGPGDRSGESGGAGLGDRSGAGAGAARSGDGSGSGGGGRSAVGGGAGIGGGRGGGEGVTQGEELPAVVGEWVAADEPAEISVPVGWWSLELDTTAAAAAVQVRADAPERHAGADEHALHGGGQAALVPVDVRLLTMYRGGPGTSALPVALAPDEDPAGRFVQVEARAWGTLAPVTVSYSFVDARGAVLASGEQVADTTTPAPFERLTAAPEDVPEDSQGRAPVVFPLGEAPLSEAVAIGLIAPPGAARVLVASGSPALLAVSGRLPAAARADRAHAWPYDQVEDPRLRWRYAPRAAPRRFPRRAEDHALRAAAGEVRTIAAQVRAEATTSAPATSGPWRAEQPRGSHARMRLLEEVPVERRRAALAAWGPGSYTRLRAGVAERLDLGVGAPRPGWLRYQAVGSLMQAIGQRVFVTVDGQGTQWPVTSRSGRMALPRRGTAGVIWSGPEALALLANRPPLDGDGELYEHRQVHQLGAGGLTLTLDKPTTAPVGMNVVVYWVDGQGPVSLAVEVDGGAPRRRQGVPVAGVFAAARTLELLPSRRVGAIFPDRRGEAEVAVGRFAVVLGDDVAPGRHTLRVRHVGGPGVWLRFFRAGKAEVKRGAWQWGERRTTVVEEDDEPEE